MYIREGFQLDVRSDGRNTEELRSIVLETGQLVQASGSARLKLGATDVLVAVKVSAGATLSCPVKDPDYLQPCKLLLPGRAWHTNA